MSSWGWLRQQIRELWRRALPNSNWLGNVDREELISCAADPFEGNPYTYEDFLGLVLQLRTVLLSNSLNMRVAELQLEPVNQLQQFKKRSVFSKQEIRIDNCDPKLQQKILWIFRNSLLVDADSSAPAVPILEDPDHRLLRVRVSRAVGSLTGLAVADSIGHNYEFCPAAADSHRGCFLEYPSTAPGGTLHQPFNSFHLKPGQWTDDFSMALCLADSLLSCGKLDGSNIRCWFWNWWNNCINTAFRYDLSRVEAVGLGGSISSSLRDVERLAKSRQPIPPRFEVNREDAGNGSLMRLAPIAIRYHCDVSEARLMARESSFTTHPGRIAAEACALMAHIIVRAMCRENNYDCAAAFLDEIRAEYLDLLPDDAAATPAEVLIRKLLLSQEADDSKERCWNWRNPNLGIDLALRNRGSVYNGYPVSANYFGSYSMDGLSIALHAIYHTNSFNQAIETVINQLGDADTTGAICGQIAGAYYGVEAIDSTWLSNFYQWDRQHETDLLAILLSTYHLKLEDGV